MELLGDPQIWLSFIGLAGLELVLGVDNIMFLSVLVGRLPPQQRTSARLLGLAFAMLTRLALLFSVLWLTTFRAPLFALGARQVTGRELILLSGGAYLAFSAVCELRQLLRGCNVPRKAGLFDGFWPTILQVGIVDVVFSLDSVFTAVGLANRVEVMVAAIVFSVGVMMWVSGAVVGFIDRNPSVKVLALAFLVMVGLALAGDALGYRVPRGYLYLAMAFSGAVEALNFRRARLAGAAPGRSENGP